jgi:hypothetical protein
VNKLIITTFLSFALFGCDDSNKQAKPTGQSSSQQEKEKDIKNNKPEGAGQNTTSPGY